MNNIVILGRLTADPVLRRTNSDVQVCNFRIAVDRPPTKAGDRVTDFFNCTAWRKTGEAIGTYFRKGQKICVSGEMQCEKYTDKEGREATGWKIIVSDFDFCESRKSDDERGCEPGEVQNSFREFSSEEDATLPF